MFRKIEMRHSQTEKKEEVYVKTGVRGLNWSPHKLISK